MHMMELPNLLCLIWALTFQIVKDNLNWAGNIYIYIYIYWLVKWTRNIIAWIGLSGNALRSLIGNNKICKECIHWHIRNLSLDVSINEFIQDYAFDSHWTPNNNLIDLTLTCTHALLVFDIGTLLVLWCALFL